MPIGSPPAVRAVDGLTDVLAARPSIAERAEETGSRGSGGDRTLVIDASAESVVFAQLDRLSADGYRFVALSEERGEIDYGDPSVRVIIDPIDGSLNAKRGLPHHALSIAVADGDTMADVVFAFVYDFGPQEEWWARRGERRLPATGPASTPPSASGAAATADSRCSESSPPTHAGSRRRSTRFRPPPIACARSARSRPRCARWPPPGSTGWSRCVAPAGSTRRPGS